MSVPYNLKPVGIGAPAGAVAVPPIHVVAALARERGRKLPMPAKAVRSA